MSIRDYGAVYCYVKPAKQPVVTKSPEEVSKGLPLVEDAKEITLAQYEPVTREHITAHRISDYRRKTFNLRALPVVDILFDRLLEGSKFYEEQLHSTSPYS